MAFKNCTKLESVPRRVHPAVGFSLEFESSIASMIPILRLS